MIVDTSALLAYVDRSEPRHVEVVAAIDGASEQLVVSPYVVAELDYLVLTRHGGAAERAVLAELSGGAWELAAMSRERLVAASALVEKYADLRIDIADASNVVLAEAYATTTIATLDGRHFEALRTSTGAALRIVP